MKINNKYMHMAIVHTATDLTSVKDLAEKTAEILGDVEVYGVNADGFTLRGEKNIDTSDSRLISAITEAIISILDENLEEATDYIMENYDFAYDRERVSKSCLKDLFDFSTSGRLIYVEIDE